MLTIMKRYAEQDLKSWYVKQNRMPLILRGARQVGKSTLVRLFCKANGIELLEVNLERVKLSSVGVDNFTVQQVFDEIQILKNQKITNNTLLFLDEIQENPKLLKFLRYFYEERPDVAIIAAGSLLEIALRSKHFSFPVGRVEFYHLGPMTFGEFLLASGEELLLEKINKLDFSIPIENRAREKFKEYLYVGGMPKAVSTFIDEKSLVDVRSIQDQIIQTYIADFPKYNFRINTDRIQKIFYSSPLHIGKKVIFQKFDSESQSRDIKRILELLIEARVLLACSHSNGNNIPLAGEADLSIFKLYFLDVGLLNCLLRLDLNVIDEEMKNKFSTKGIIIEQFVAQHLNHFDGNSMSPSLYYWLRDKGVQKGEVDFLLQRGSSIYPIEVKSVGAGHLKAAFYFAKEKKINKLIRISTLSYNKKSVSHKIGDDNIEINMIDLPVFAIETLRSIIDNSK